MRITNADQGVVLTWEAGTPAYCASGTYGFRVCNTQVAAASTYGMGSNTVSSAVWPVLQAQDGSFYGTDWAGNMVRFTQYGNVIWSVPGDSPQIATADGGVIGSSGITYDSQGRATGQIATMPTYSWKGAYTDGPVDSVVPAFNLANIAPTFAAVPGGNLTGGGTAHRHKVFKLSWCAHHACTLTYNPPYGGAGITDSDVNYFYQEVGPNPTIQLNALEIGIIKNQALAALKQAYHAFPAIVLAIEGDDGQEPYTNLVEVSGNTAPGAGVICGLTGPNRTASTAWYECNMDEAQWALNLQNTDLSKKRGTPKFQQLLQDIGSGIGNTGAHEIAHQWLDVACGMNDDDPNKLGVYDGGNPTDPTFYTGVGPSGEPIHWSLPTAKCLTERILNDKSLFEVQ